MNDVTVETISKDGKNEIIIMFIKDKKKFVVEILKEKVFFKNLEENYVCMMLVINFKIGEKEEEALMSGIELSPQEITVGTDEYVPFLKETIIDGIICKIRKEIDEQKIQKLNPDMERGRLKLMLEKREKELMLENRNKNNNVWDNIRFVFRKWLNYYIRQIR